MTQINASTMYMKEYKKNQLQTILKNGVVIIIKYKIVESERVEAKHKVVALLDGVPVEMHLNEDLSINKPFIMDEAVSFPAISTLMLEIVKHFETIK